MAVPSRSRLGRGIGALLSSSTESPASDVAVRPVPDAPPPREGLKVLSILEIDVNPNQPRRNFDEASLDELAASIKANGIIQPIIVRPIGDRFELVAGERRYRAARKAGLLSLPAIVRELDAYTQAQWALVENIHRQDLNALERAEAYATLMGQLGLTQAELATRLGEQRSSIANHLRLLELGDVTRAAVRAGQLSLGHAKVLAGVTPIEAQNALTESCVLAEWSVRELEQQISVLPPIVAENASKSVVEPAAQAHFVELEAHLAQHLGVRVNLRRGKKQGTGQIVLHYASLDQFDDLVRRWGVDLGSR